MANKTKLDELIELFGDPDLGGRLLSATEEDQEAFGNFDSEWQFSSFVLRVTYDRSCFLLSLSPSFNTEMSYDIIDVGVLLGELSPPEIRSWETAPSIEYWVGLLKRHYRDLTSIFSPQGFQESKVELDAIEKNRVDAFEKMLRGIA